MPFLLYIEKLLFKDIFAFSNELELVASSNNGQGALWRRSRPIALICLFWALLALFVFREAIPPGQVIQATDFNVGVLAGYKSHMPADFVRGAWYSAPLLGRVGHRSINFTHVLLWLCPLELYADWIYPL